MLCGAIRPPGEPALLQTQDAYVRQKHGDSGGRGAVCLYRRRILVSSRPSACLKHPGHGDQATLALQTKLNPITSKQIGPHCHPNEYQLDGAGGVHV